MENGMSKRLREARGRADMTQKQLADLAGIATSSVSAYEKGLKVPALDVAARIASALGVSLDWIVNGDNAQRSIATKGDVLRILYSLSEKMGGAFTFGAVRGGASMFIDDRDIGTYFTACERMEANYKDGLIDQEILSLWQEKQIKQLEKIPAQNRATTKDENPF